MIGFAAETETVVENAQAKRKSKGADWIVANDVSPASGVFGGERNTVHLVTAGGDAGVAELVEGGGSGAPHGAGRAGLPARRFRGS